MRLPQIVIYEPDDRLKLQLEALAEQRRWALPERRPETCLRLLARGGPAVLVLKAGRDLERELALLERAAWLYPDAPVVLAADGDRPGWPAWPGTSAPTYVLLPPQPPAPARDRRRIDGRESGGGKEVTAELPLLDETRCTGCGDCVAVCPTGCLAGGNAPWMPRPLDCVGSPCASASAPRTRCAWTMASGRREPADAAYQPAHAGRSPSSAAVS